MQLTRSRLLVAALLLVAARPARAEDIFVVKTQVYADSDNTVVVSPLVRVGKDLWKGGSASAGIVADVVSSASVDVITNATKKMTDFRKEASFSLSQKLAATTLDAGYVYSTENDYSSHNIALGITHDLFQKNTTLGLHYALSLDDVGRSQDPTFHRALDVHAIDASFTQVLGPRTLLFLSYAFQLLDGYQASPYRFVRVDADSAGSAILFKVPETDPTLRLRNAFVAGIKRHVGKDSSLDAEARVYVDNWGVSSFTGLLQYDIEFGALILRLRERFYYQTAASFFQPHYTEAAPYITADRELSTFWSDVAGIKLLFKLDRVAAGLTAELKVDGFYFEYIDFAYLASRTGADVEAGLTMRF